MMDRSFLITSLPTGFRVSLKDKPFLTPTGHSFDLPSRFLAEAIVKEGQAQGIKMVPSTMPFTQLAATALDRTSSDVQSVINRLISYADNDLLCHRAEDPPLLVKRQNDCWQPLLEWCAEHFDARLEPQTGLMPRRQKADVLATFQAILKKLDPFLLTGLQQATLASGSLVIGLAIMEMRLPASDAFEAAELDILYQIEKWGEDPETRQHLDTIQQDLHVCERWFSFLRPA